MELLPLHSVSDSDIRLQCCAILNQEWPRSEVLRLRSLDSSDPDLPMNLALVQWFPLKDTSSPVVVGHSRLTRIPSHPQSVWIESVVVRSDLRGKNIGKYLMLRTEQFCRDHLGFKSAYLCTFDQQIFYAKLGYSFCEPVCAYGGNVKLPENLVRARLESRESSVLPNKVTNLTSTNCSPPPPPPPLPPKAPPVTELETVPDAEEDVAVTCSKVFKRLQLEDILAPLLQAPPQPLVIDSSHVNKVSGCRATLHKDYMKKVL